MNGIPISIGIGGTMSKIECECEYSSACMQSSAALFSVSIGIMAILFITNLSPFYILIIDTILTVAVLSLIGTIIASQQELSKISRIKNPSIIFIIGVISMGFVTIIITIYTYVQSMGS